VRYLDTCGVREPERVAKEYLVLGVELSRALETGDVEAVAGTYAGALESAAARRLAGELERTADGEPAADDAFGHLGL
jgi:hypothetical protein